ncbi:MAG: hypothetical protein HQ474_03270 [Flammeovirgaceae bacterium]|nr:hypothetical protein [Flammeovirgaceae bacterium]
MNKYFLTAIIGFFSVLIGLCLGLWFFKQELSRGLLREQKSTPAKIVDLVLRASLRAL